MKSCVIPDYWKKHLDEKISAINNLENSGDDCFSFVVMTDMHYPRNMGRISPLLAKEVLDRTKADFALCLGDLQTSGCYDTKEEILNEYELIEDMISPIRDRLLITEGNHDGSYGWLYYDKDGNLVDSTSEDIARKKAYVTNLSPEELYEIIYKKVALTGKVTFDEGGGNGYWKDDEKNKVRFVMLNSCCNEYEILEDGTSRYPKMRIPKFSQSQFDMLIKALSSVPDDTWSVVVAAHHPLDNECVDKNLMTEVLSAYKNKTAFKGERTYENEYVAVNCDFAGAKGELVGYFFGHIHYDGNYVSRNVQMISTTCDTAHEDAIPSLRKQRVKGTITEQAFDVFTVDKTNKKVYATRIGLGNDRIIDF